MQTPTQQRIRQMCFPRLALITHNHTLDTGWVFSRALRSLHVLPRLTPFICFPALGVECISSRAWRRLQAFQRLTPVKCFPRLAMILRSPDEKKLLILDKLIKFKEKIITRRAREPPSIYRTVTEQNLNTKHLQNKQLIFLSNVDQVFLATLNTPCFRNRFSSRCAGRTWI